MSKGFGNKAEIVSMIKYVQLSANTTMRRIDAVSHNVTDQLMNVLGHVASIHCRVTSLWMSVILQ
jgi:hypothetical protein